MSDPQHHHAPSTVEPPLVRPGWRPIALSLGLGAVGGAVFWLLDIPLAWMLGPMVVNIAASVAGWRVLIPNQLRVVVLCVVGVFLGGSFSPDLIERSGAWLASLSLMLLFVPLITATAFAYFRWVAGFDRATAVFSGAPGTLTAMTMIGAESGADERLIALSQGLRVVCVVILMPQVVTLLLASAPQLAPVAAVSAPFAWGEAALLLAAAAIGYGLAALLRFPAAAMTGAMVAAAALYLAGVVGYHPPEMLQGLSFWILGSAIGSRFSTVSTATFFRVAKHGVAATAITVTVSALFAYGAGLLTGTPFLTALISFTPGGIPEMSMIAIAFGIDPAYVAVHHLTRIAILIIATPLAARLLFRPAHRAR